MTMPQLLNCSHQGDGWCLQCVNNLFLEKETLQKERETLRDTLREVQLNLLKCEKANLYTTSHQLIQLITQVLDGCPIGEYILREEAEVRIKAAQDAADAFVVQQRMNDNYNSGPYTDRR